MLERIREGSQGFWAIVVLGLVILSFLFAGIGGYMNSASDVAAATVNGDEISQSTLERAYNNERSRLESQFGDAFAALAADESYLRQFRRNVLDRLIGDKLIEQTARDLGLRVSDEQIRTAILEMPEFQIGGQFNNDRFQQILRQAGFQVNGFRDYMRVEMTRQQVSRALLASEFALSNEAKDTYALQQQKRDIKYLTIPSAPFAENISLSDEEINEYYEANLGSFDTNEQVSLAYVELTVADIIPNIETTEDELQAFYNQSADLYRTEEQRRVSHVLIEFGEDKDAAKAQTEALLDSLNNGADFATVAKENSSDTFSAENGGDLDFIGRGAMDPAFEEAAYALPNVGDMSTVVESAFGFHIIKLTDIKPQEVTPFADVRDDIETRVKTDKATEEFFALQERMAQVAFEIPESLDEVAAEVNKPINTTELFTRDTPPAPVSNPVVVTKAFSNELIEDQVNSEVIQIANDHIMVIRVTEHQPERTKALDEVKGEIEQYLTADKSQQAAMDWALTLVTAMDAGEDISAQLAERELVWQEQKELARFGSSIENAIVEQAFQMSLQDNKDKGVVETASGDVSLVQLVNVVAAPAANSEQLLSLQRRLESTRSQAAYTGLIESLKAKADIAYLIN